MFLLFRVQSMGEDPVRMHSHVMRTMFSHAQCYNIFGPVFFQIKKALAPQWVEPHSLQQLCRKSIRQSLFRGPHGNAHPDTVAELNMPKPLESYVSYHDWTTTARLLHDCPRPSPHPPNTNYALQLSLPGRRFVRMRDLPDILLLHIYIYIYVRLPLRFYIIILL